MLALALASWCWSRRTLALVRRFAQVVTRECVRGSTHDQIASVLADVEQKIHSSKPDRTPERSREHTPTATPVPAGPRPVLPSVPAVVRNPQPQEPHPTPMQAQPNPLDVPQRECKVYFPLVGINVIVPCA